MIGTVILRRLPKKAKFSHDAIRGWASVVETNSSLNLKSMKNANLIASNEDCLKELESGLSLIPDFISEEEESSLFDEVNPYLRKLRLGTQIINLGFEIIPGRDANFFVIM